VFEVFFEERGLIPPGHLHEVCFEELEEDPIGQLQMLYERLDQPRRPAFGLGKPR
jgi:hypothetical protein